jgi:hypothetical protein
MTGPTNSQPSPDVPQKKTDGDQGPKPKRRIRNFLLQPLLQVKLGIYAIFLSFLFVATTSFLLYSNFANFVDAVVQLTDVEDDVKDLFLEYWSGTRLWIIGCCVGYFIATIIVSVIYTHRLVGPTVAFRRHIRSLREGRFQSRTFLRRGDAFSEVADELNLLSEVLEKGKLPHYVPRKD